MFSRKNTHLCTRFLSLILFFQAFIIRNHHKRFEKMYDNSNAFLHALLLSLKQVFNLIMLLFILWFFCYAQLVTISNIYTYIYLLFIHPFKGQIKPEVDWHALNSPKNRTNHFFFLDSPEILETWNQNFKFQVFEKNHSFVFWWNLWRANLLLVLSDL